MTAMLTTYDQVAYPSMIFRKSHPDRLAVIARLHGMEPPAIETARVLQIGGGDGLDAIALATAFPRAHFVNFDIAAQPIARGRRWSEAAGIANVRHEILDILDAGEQLDGPFDYVIAHGIYAWVPEPVRAAVMPLIRRLLAPNGVAFVSYNTFPGGHSRIALREMMRHHVAHITSPPEQLAAVRALLHNFVKAQPTDEPITAAMRREAEAALAYPDGLLFHDGLNAFYYPQSFTAAVHDAQAHGLSYLGEASGGGLDKGFLDADRAGIEEKDLLHRLQALDYSNGRYFRTSLFVQAEARFSRVAFDEAARTMWVTTGARAATDALFQVGKRTIRINDPGRAALLRSIIAARPNRMPVASLAADAELLAALRHYALEDIVELSTVPAPFSSSPADKPQASPLARMQIAEGSPTVATLDHQLITLQDEDLRLLIRLLDGTRDRVALKRCWAEGAASMPLDRALELIAAKALLVADRQASGD
ncbi:class I SAM-dependent methyltransferase [Sphingomonas crusticola]|uniref:class I SAM-dependent methyltransferase n=1 Tax=Sphingomonas crusticola TaxID=1697973 RepID=UPI000E256B58|nr:class I SAM-dependent methyltransferase [Sphingomonas crusticola]